LLNTATFINKFSDKLIIKKINNILTIGLNKRLTPYSPNKGIKVLKNYFTYSYIIYFLNIVWRGKAYRIRFFKKNCKFTLNFGHSHWYKFVYDKNIFSFYRLKRQKYFVIYKNRFDYQFLKKTIENIRPYNKYTRRGIRLKRSVFIKRFGKISQVNSILHQF
jgi:hypothetical protein